MAAERALCLAVLALLLASCGVSAESDNTSNGSGTKDRGPRLVAVTHPYRTSLSRTLEVTGDVLSLKEAEITARLSGALIIEMSKELGDTVIEGEILARLDRVDYQRAEKEAKSALAEAAGRVKEAKIAVREIEGQRDAALNTIAYKQKILDRAEEQSSKGAVAAKVFDDAKYDHQTESAALERLKVQLEKAEAAATISEIGEEKAKLALEKAERDLELTIIRAPFAGVIKSRNVSSGVVATAAQPLYSMFDPSSVVVDFNIPQRNFSEVREGLDVTLVPQTLSGATVPGLVQTIAPVVESGTIKVRVKPSDPSLLRPGQFVSGSIILEIRENSLVVPRKALDNERQRPFVLRYEAGNEATTGTVRRVYFKEGLAQGDVVEFLPLEAGAEMLTEAHQIVLVGLDGLRDGDPVRIRAEAPTEPKENATASEGDRNGG